MIPLKPLSADAVPAALTKAERYRLLNEPHQAESICEDILAADWWRGRWRWRRGWSRPTTGPTSPDSWPSGALAP